MESFRQYESPNLNSALFGIICFRCHVKKISENVQGIGQYFSHILSGRRMGFIPPVFFGFVIARDPDPFFPLLLVVGIIRRSENKKRFLWAPGSVSTPLLAETRRHTRPYRHGYLSLYITLGHIIPCPQSDRVLPMSSIGMIRVLFG